MPKKPKPSLPTADVEFLVIHDGVDTQTIQDELVQFIQEECKPFLKKLAVKIRSYGEEQNCNVTLNLNDFPPLAR